MSTPTSMIVRFKKAEPKKWSTRYNEVDDSLNDISDEWPLTKIGSVYIKHATPIGKLSPEYIEVTVSVFAPEK
jgi:hypothetical protein